MTQQQPQLVDSLHVLGLQILHDRALQEAPGCVVGRHYVGLPVPGQLLQSIAATAQPGFTVCDPIKAPAVSVETIPESPHLRHYYEVFPVKPAGHKLSRCLMPDRDCAMGSEQQACEARFLV